VHFGGEFFNRFHCARNFPRDFLGGREVAARAASNAPPFRFSSGFAMAPDSTASMSANARCTAGSIEVRKPSIEVHAADVECEVKRIHAAEVLP